MKYGTFLLFLFFSFFTASASDTTHIPLERQSRHGDIRQEQINCERLDGKQDWLLHAGSNEAINAQVTDALLRKPNEFRNWIEENDKELPLNNDKVRYLRYISEVLVYFRLNARAREITVTELPSLLANFEKIMKAKAAGESMLPYLEQASYAVAKINAGIFSENADRNAANAIIYLKYSAIHPDRILQTIEPYVNESYADTLIGLACRMNPEQFYSYAQSPQSPVGKLIHRNTDPMVMLVAELSRTGNALFYFPFLDDLLSGRQSIDNIKKLVGDGVTGYDSVGYFKLLSRTATAYSRRMAAPLRDTAIAYYGSNGLFATLQRKAIDHFITPINRLHNENNLAVRMRAIQPLAPADLYYMLVAGENDIYTSSYKHSFNRLLQLMGNTGKPRGDSLLLSVHFDHFRKFIKMAANYNKLDTFLKTMPPVRAELLMRNFVANLDNNHLEDAVDVADSYGSITNKKLQQSMLANIIQNEKDALAESNKSAATIYNILKTIFLSFEEGSNVDLSAQIGIPPVYEVSNKYLQDEKGRVSELVFWYGDEDGKAFYPPFRNSFSPKNWKITDKKEWMEAASLHGNVTVYANKPLESDANMDDSAQAHLISYLEEKEVKPSIVVHRGHSYWLKGTLARMPGDAKIVVLGSCGGYQNLNAILEINPDAHIISTKEIGAGDINRPILNYMNDVLSSGNDLSWRKMWQNLGKNFAAEPNRALRDSWDDYIPPYKNLGAIFLKAYARKMDAE